MSGSSAQGSSNERRRLIWVVVVSLTLALIGAGYCFLRILARAKINGGPGIHYNLITLEVAKARWQADHPEIEWPTRQDLVPYLTISTNSKSFDDGIQTRVNEIYIINKTGAPLYAYDPRTERLHSLDSNGMKRVEMMIENYEVKRPAANQNVFPPAVSN